MLRGPGLLAEKDRCSYHVTCKCRAMCWGCVVCAQHGRWVLHGLSQENNTGKPCSSQLQSNAEPADHLKHTGTRVTLKERMRAKETENNRQMWKAERRLGNHASTCTHANLGQEVVNHTVASPGSCCCVCWAAVRASALAVALSIAVATSTCNV